MRRDAQPVRDDVEMKFVRDGRERKAVVQLLEGISWLEAQRKKAVFVRGIELSKIRRVIPLLVTAERALRFPPATLWLNHRMRTVKSELQIKSPGALQHLVVCGTEDLENLEQIAFEGGESIVAALERHVAMPRAGGEALWQHYEHPRASHPRLRPVLDAWLAELRARGAVPAVAP